MTHVKLGFHIRGKRKRIAAAACRLRLPRIWNPSLNNFCSVSKILFNFHIWHSTDLDSEDEINTETTKTFRPYIIIVKKTHLWLCHFGQIIQSESNAVGLKLTMCGGNPIK